MLGRFGTELGSFRAAVAVAGVVVMAAAAGYALASGGSTITVCVRHSGGGLYRKASCASGDARLTWNSQGPRGPRGAAGAPAPSHAYLRYWNLGKALPSNSPVDVATLGNLPAGKYALQATVQVENSNQTTAGSANCGFDRGHQVQHPYLQVTLSDAADQAPLAAIPVMDTVTLTGTSNSVSVACDGYPPAIHQLGVTANSATIVAIRVGALTEVRDPFRG